MKDDRSYGMGSDKAQDRTDAAYGFVEGGLVVVVVMAMGRLV